MILCSVGLINTPPPPPQRKEEHFVFKHPFTMTVSEVTSCVKTYFVKQLLQNSHKFIKPTLQRIIWLYKRWQPLYDEIQRTVTSRVEFVQGIPIDLEKDSYICLSTKCSSFLCGGGGGVISCGSGGMINVGGAFCCFVSFNPRLFLLCLNITSFLLNSLWQSEQFLSILPRVRLLSNYENRKKISYIALRM
jgi:hypothetical protein